MSGIFSFDSLKCQINFIQLGTRLKFTTIFFTILRVSHYIV